MRILVLIAIGLLLYIIIGNLFKKKNKSASNEELNEMVRCSHCGIHVLEQEAIQAEGHYYCSKEHLEAEQKK